uniref:RNA binding motif protein 20 n=1 Tax=Callorhinchus milii TaxID=7868 RepID=A0A4W3K2A8_CALMI
LYTASLQYYFLAEIYLIFLETKNIFCFHRVPRESPLNPLLPSPASVQLAQLHAQLTLHRLKLAQSAVHNNTAAASVLNHVLSKVAMSQPLFNTLRTSSMLSPTHGQPGGAQMTVGIPGKAIGPGGLQFSAQAPGLPPMLGGGMNLQAPNPASIGLNPYVGLAPGQPATQPGDFSSKTSDREYRPADEARHNQGFHQYGAVGIPGKGQHFVHPSPHPGFQPDFQVPPTTTGGQQPGCRMPGPGFPGDRNTGTFPQNPEVLRLMDSGGQGVWAPEQWHNSAPFAQPSGGHEYPARSDNCWPAKSRPLPTANDLYNPEEPTGEAKLNLRGGSLFNRFRNFPGPPYGQSDNHSHLVPERQLQPHEHNDFHGIVPSQLPHICSICDKKVFNLKDWDQHVNGKHHIQNCECANHYATGLHKTYEEVPLSSTVIPLFAQFPQRKSGPSRVVHICNIPEGSCTESDVINLGLPFGKVTNYILMRATSQAFLEMAYPEAAQAMVQFYQQKPPVFSEQQLLVRMSKQYKELKLKKPGKNVESIINDINSQREREVYKDLDRFPEERTRSRSPLARSSSPWMESHSPSFASCSSSHPKATSRGERNNGTEQRGSWEYLAHTGRREEEKEDSISRSYGEESRDRTDKWGHDRKQHSKSSARLSPKSLEDRGDAAHRQKDKHVKSSPVPFQAKYKTRNEEDYRKEHKLKSTRSQHSPRSKGKESEFPQRSGNRGTSTSQDQTENRSEHDSHRSPVHSPTWESGSEAEGEGWYQCRMEEFVTVDEVGGEEEHSMEVEAEKLEIKESDCVEPNDRRMQMSPEALVTKDMVSDWEKNSEDHCRVSSDGSRPMSPTPTIGSDRISMESVSYSQVTQPILELPGNNEQVSQPQQSPLPREQDNVFCNLSIPLGVEFVEPRTGFYCKLCGIFYITEEAAKTSHCRSTIHYKNLQRYLSQLAEDSLREGQGDRNPGREEEVGIVPQFESKRSSPP